jgi:nucleoside-diphosphate-sugar epimerase
MGARYLLTGGAGFIGSHIARRLIAKGANVRIVDDLSTGLRSRIDDIENIAEFIKGDISDPTVTDDVIKGVDFVLHQAAIPSVQRSISDPISTNRANVTGTLNLLESCRKAAVRRFVFAASSSAYGDTIVLPKREDMPADPLSPYALQKFVGERYCKLYYTLYGIETVSLRYFNVFGPTQDPDSEYSAVIPKFITAILNNEPLAVYGNGEQSRDFTYVDNIVDANLLALKSDKAPGQVCNVGCGERVTLNQLIRLLEEIIGHRADVTYVASRPGDVRDSLADIGLAQRLLSYKPSVLLKDGLQRTVESFVEASEKHD